MVTSRNHRDPPNQAMPANRTSVPETRTSSRLVTAPAAIHFGEMLRSARARVGLTQDQFGQLIGYSRTAVSRLESSPDPRLTPRALRCISEVLNTPTAALLGETGNEEDAVKRRHFIQAATGVALSMANATMDPGRVGTSDVEEIERGIENLRALDQRNGGDRLGLFAERLVSDAERLLSGSYGPAMATRLHGVLGEACVLGGWLAQDSGHPERAIRLYSEVMAAAPMAEDPLLTAHACANLSLLTVEAGQPSRAVKCAQAGQVAALEGRGGPRLRALLLAREATGHAQLGDVAATEDTMRRALLAFDSVHGHDPAWTAFLSDVELAGILGDAYTRLGQHSPALRQLEQAAAMPGRPRNAASWRLVLAYGHAAAGDPAQAAALGLEALPHVLDLSSARVRGRVLTLSAMLAPHSRIREVSDFRDHARAAGLAA